MEEIVYKWYKNDGSSNNKLEQLELKFKCKLPIEYKEFVLWSNGGEGIFGLNNISLWKIEDIQQLNLDYNIQHYLSDNIMGIGTDGGSICYAIDLNNNNIIKVPLGDLDVNEIQKISDSFGSFLGKLLYVII